MKTKSTFFYVLLVVISMFFVNIVPTYAEVYTPIDGDTGETEVARRTYLFYLNEEDIASNNYVDKQILKNGETPITPQTPTLSSGEEFLGWYKYENGALTNTKFANTTVNNLTEDESYIYVAKIQKYYQLRFIDVENNNNVFKTIKGEFTGSSVTVSLNTINSISIPGNVNLERAQIAWSLEKDGSAINNDLVITEAGVINLYPVYGEVKWLIFDSNASSGEQYTTIAPQSIYGTKVTVAPATNPTRVGYTFVGWYKDKDCTQKFQFGSTISENTTIYAKWEAGNANYKIVHWIEVLPDNKKHDVYTNGQFDFSKATWAIKSTVEKNGKIGTQITIGDSDKLSIPYYEYYKADTKVISANGNTIINVYYRLKEYTYTFDLDDYNGLFGSRTSTLKINGNSYGTNEYKITAVLNEDISDRWPTVVTSVYTGWADDDEFYAWDTASQYDQVTKIYNLTAELIPNANTTNYTAKALFGGTRWEQVNYWLQDANGEYYIDHTEYMEIVHTSGNIIGKQLSGFTYLGNNVTPSGNDANGNPYPNYDGGYITVDGKNVHVNNFYYNRNSYLITFEETSGQNISALYGSAIADKIIDPSTGKIYEPAPRDGYTFMGWYEVVGDSLIIVDSFDGRLMPEHDLLFRPIWKKNPVKLTFETDGGVFDDNTTTKEYELEENTKFTEEAPNVTRENYSFIGWAYKDGAHAGELFNFNETYISSNTTLIALWKFNSVVKVKYTTDINKGSFDGNDTYTDENEYSNGVEVTLLNAPDTVNNGYRFIGWRLENSDTIIYGSLVISDENIVNGIVTLVAVYEEDISNVTVTYNTNYNGLGTDKSYTTDEEINNDSFVLLTLDGVNFSAPVGYKFVGWSKNADGSGTIYAPGKTIAADINSENNLYAIWEKDESQTKDLTYIVEHVVDGEVRDTKTYTVTVWVNDPDTIEIEEGSLAQHTYTGYKFDNMTPEVNEGEKVSNGTTITLTYVKDESQTKDLTYTVEHVVDGEVRDTKTYTVTVWVNDPDTIEVVTGSLTPNEYVGYKYTGMNPEIKENTLVENNTKIQLLYTAVYGNVIIHYVDLDGNTILEDTTMNSLVGTSYNVTAPEIDNYSLVEIKGDVTGNYIEGDIEITFVYEEYGIGGDEEEPVVEPISNIVNPKTSDNMINYIIMITFGLFGLLKSTIYLKKEKYVKID